MILFIFLKNSLWHISRITLINAFKSQWKLIVIGVGMITVIQSLDPEVHFFVNMCVFYLNMNSCYESRDSFLSIADVFTSA